MGFSLFSDCSFDPTSKKSVGAWIWFDDSSISENANVEITLTPLIKTFQFDCASCAQGEILSMIYALREFDQLSSTIQESSTKAKKPGLSLFTDSKTIAELQSRRPKLESTSFKSRRTNELLSNAKQYKDVYELLDRLESSYKTSIHWVKGHTQAGNRSFQEKVLTLVDQAARKALRSRLQPLCL